MMGKLTVIIPVYRPDVQFHTLLNKISEQSVKPDKVLLLWTIPEGSNAEDTEIIAAGYIDYGMKETTEVVYIPQDEFDHGGTRRYGMSLVNTEYALCMTQDAVPYDDKLFEELLNAYEVNNNYSGGSESDNVRVAAVYARQLPNDKATPTERITREFNYPDEERIQNMSTLDVYGIKTYFCSDVCAMYRMDAYREAGGFVEKTIFNEDMLMAAALINKGYTVRYVPSARVIHSHHYTYRQQYKRNFDNAVSHRQYAKVFDSVPAEGEGIRLVLTTMKKLVKAGKLHLIPDLVIQSAYKYMGYRSGKRYDRMSKKKILKKTMNRGYWTDYNNGVGE